MKTFFIGPDDADIRIDRFARKILPTIPLSHVYRSIRKKRFKVNGKAISIKYILKKGDKLDIYIDENEIFSASSKKTGDLSKTVFFKNNFNIVYEDKEILALNKPAGISVHPGTKNEKGTTLIDLIRSYLPHEASATFTPALVHRLDKETSGVILAAKTKHALRELTNFLKDGLIKKEYAALVCGKMGAKNGTIKQRLLRVRDSDRGGKVTAVSNGSSEGQSAVTHYKKIEDYNGFSLLSVYIETGRTHQIRVHFATDGHPVAGDKDYGNENLNKFLKNKTGLNRQFLHARSLEFKHPKTGVLTRIVAPLPHDLSKCIDYLKLRSSET